MKFISEKNRIYYSNQEKILAEITFSDIDAETVEINHTFVDEQLRGQGTAGKLMEETVIYLRSLGKKAVPTCSYAVAWFEKHPEYSDILKAVNKEL